MRALFLLIFFWCSAVAHADDLHLTQEERNWLDAHQDSLVLSFEFKFPPFEFLSSEGHFSGLSADLIAIIEKRLGITLRKQSVEQWTEILSGLHDGETAVVPSITVTEERQSYAFFTRPYAEVPIVIMTRRNEPRDLTLDTLDGRVVAVVRGYASADLVRSKSAGRFRVREVDSIQEGLHEVSFGLADAVVESLAVASWYIEQEGITNLQVSGTTGVLEPLSIGISRKYPLLASAMDKALESIPPEEIKALTNKWIDVNPPLLARETLLALKFATVLTTAIVAILLVLAWFLRKRLREKIADLTMTKAELTTQLQRVHLALETTNAGYWEYYPLEDREEHSDEWYTMLGYTPQRASSNLSSWSELLHPADRDQAIGALQRYLTSNGQGLYQAEYRMRTADGSWQWILGKGRAVSWNKSGLPTKIIGLNIDIHTLKQTQESLRQSEALTKAIFDQTFQLMGLVDLDGYLVMCNRAALDFAALSEEDVLHRQFWDTPWWVDKSETKALLEEGYDTARRGGVFRREIIQRLHNGRTAEIDFSVSPLHDADSTLIAFIVEGRDIAALKKAQREAEENEQCFRTIFDCAPYAITINRIPGGQYVDANTTFLERVEIDRSTLLQMTPTELGLLKPETLDTIRRMLREDKPILNLETEIVRRNGEIGQILYSAGKVTIRGENCVLSMVVDISDLKQTQEALRRSEEMFSRLFHLSPDMIAVARQSDGTLLEINEAFSRFTGYSREESIGRTTLELGIFATPARRQEFADTLLRETLVENFSFDIRHRDGRILNCSASARLLQINQEPCILSITRDITHIKTMQEMMVQSEKMLSLGGIAAGIAHEINNPLGIILQAAQTLTVRTDPAFPKNIQAAQSLNTNMDGVSRYMRHRKIDVFIRDIEGAAARAAAIVRHMLNFSRKSESKHALCDIHVIIEQALSLAANYYDLKRKFDFKTITIVRDFSANLPHICCTETEIEQVLLNLFRNAAQAMAESASVIMPTLRISTSRIGQAIRIEIQDNGPGIAPEIRSRIFEPFFTTKDPGSGTGLGLSVSYFIITKGHDGSMNVSSAPGQGTTFVIDLPVNNKPAQCPILSETGRNGTE